MDLSEIKNKFLLAGRCVSEMPALYADDAMEWLIAEVERQREEISKLTVESLEMSAGLAEFTVMQQAVREATAEVERLTDECARDQRNAAVSQEESVRLLGEVERLEAFSQQVMNERHEAHDRLLARAEKAEGEVERLRVENAAFRDSDGYRAGLEWAMMETRGCADSCQPHDTAREYLVFLAQEMERHIKSLSPSPDAEHMEEEA